VWSGTGTFYYRDFSIFGIRWRTISGNVSGAENCRCGIRSMTAACLFLAQWNTLCLYPPSLFYLVLPLSWALGVFCLAHLYAGGLGCISWCDAGQEVPSPQPWPVWPSLVHGLAWHALMWPNNIAALGWMPWVVGAVEQAWREGGRRVAVAALVGGLQMLAGAPEIIGFTWLAAGAVGVEQFFAAGAPRAVMARRLGAVVLLVALLAGAQLLPFLDLLAHSQRGAEFGDRTWAMPWWGWANFLVPRFHSRASFHGVYVQQGQYWTTTYYAGAGIVLLGVIAALRVRDRRAIALLALGLAGMVLALGDAAEYSRCCGRWCRRRASCASPSSSLSCRCFAAPVLAGFAVRCCWRKERISPGASVSCGEPPWTDGGDGRSRRGRLCPSAAGG
jgi:hypothetical protein